VLRKRVNRGFGDSRDKVFLGTPGLALTRISMPRPAILSCDVTASITPKGYSLHRSAGRAISVIVASAAVITASRFSSRVHAEHRRAQWALFTTHKPFPGPGEPSTRMSWEGYSLEIGGAPAVELTGSDDPANHTTVLAYRPLPSPPSRRMTRGRQTTLQQFSPGAGPGTGKLKWYFPFKPRPDNKNSTIQ